MMTRRGGIRRREIITLLCISALFLGSQPAGATRTANGSNARPSKYTPSYVQSQMGYEDWGNAAYFFQWKLSSHPHILRSYSSGAAKSAEIGWKRTGFRGCRIGNGLSASGIPSGVYYNADYTEDQDDAVLFLQMAGLWQDQRDNPNKLYSAWWACGDSSGDNAFNPTTSKPMFNSQEGTADRPHSSYSIAQLNLWPARTGFLAFTKTNPNPGRHRVGWLYQPWTSQWNFEGGVGAWNTYSASSDHQCGGAAQGSCYARLIPGADAYGFLYQRSSMENWAAADNGAAARATIKESDPNNREGLGDNFQYDGNFRCVTVNIVDCTVTIWVKGSKDSWRSSDGRVVTIPNNGNWYYVTDDRWMGPTNYTNEFDVWIQSTGTLHLDAQWVSNAY